jgi:aspartyl-tRNA(Asn)/glutamyl-tRNA(Gln) amidotransferase subunit C
MSFSAIDKVAKSARISFSAEELSRMHDKISGVVSWLNEIKKIDVTGYEPIFNISDDGSREYRINDIVSESNPSFVLQNAQSVSSGFYLVPKVVHKD